MRMNRTSSLDAEAPACARAAAGTTAFAAQPAMKERRLGATLARRQPQSQG
jgi:hypothetical protein